MNRYFKDLPVKEPLPTRKGRRIQFTSSPKWFRMANWGHLHVVSVNNNLYGFHSFLNDGRKGCKIDKNKLYNAVYLSLLELKRLGL